MKKLTGKLVSFREANINESSPTLVTKQSTTNPGWKNVAFQGNRLLLSNLPDHAARHQIDAGVNPPAFIRYANTLFGELNNRVVIIQLNLSIARNVADLRQHQRNHVLVRGMP